MKEGRSSEEEPVSFLLGSEKDVNRLQREPDGRFYDGRAFEKVKGKISRTYSKTLRGGKKSQELKA